MTGDFMDVKDIKNDMYGSGIKERRKILVVGEEGFFPESVMDYAILVAGRLDYDILTLNAVSEEKLRSISSDNTGPDRTFDISEIHSCAVFKAKAASGGVNCECIVRAGDPGETAEKIIHEIKRIEFLITGSDETKEKIAEKVTIPVFSVLSNNHIKGGKIMGEEIRKKKPIGKTVGYGALTAVLYAAVFMNADTVTSYFTKGSWYAALPIATVFIFSFAHGAFASNLWSLLGIEAVRKDVKVVTAEKTVHEDIRTKKIARKRPRARAYINPFHRI